MSSTPTPGFDHGQRTRSMVAHCLFCSHSNPARAKYCNECGSPLHLKPCKECDAINNAAAEACYKCGAADPGLTTPYAATLTPTVEGLAALTPVDATVGRGPVSRGDSVARNPERRSPWLPADTAAAKTPDVSDAGVTTPLWVADERPEVRENPDTSPDSVSEHRDRSAGRRPRLRIAIASMAIVLLGAIALPAYYAYRNPAKLADWLSSARAMVGPSADEHPEQSASETNVAPTAGGSIANAGTATIAAPAPPEPQPSAGPATNAAMLQAPADSTPMSDAPVNGAASPSNPLHGGVTSPIQVSTRGETISQSVAPHVEKKSPSASKKKSKKTQAKKTAAPPVQ